MPRTSPLCVVTRIPYRGGRVHSEFLRLEQSAAVDHLHEELAAQLDKRPDNHTTYLVSDGEREFGIFFTDGNAHFGVPAASDQRIWDEAIRGMTLEQALMWTSPT